MSFLLKVSAECIQRLHDRSAVEGLSGPVEMVREPMAEGAHSFGGVSWSAVDEM
jgi:hypothetical protein